MYISRHNIGKLYEQKLIREMDQKIINYLNDNTEELPFSNIFGDTDLRIVIPIITDTRAKYIIDALKRIKDYGGLDLDSNEVIRKIKLNPKYGGGEKEQRIKIGSAISNLKISDEEKKKYLEWLALYKENLKDTLENPKYSIVLSRAPIDVLRMSDFESEEYNEKIKSCHSQGEQYFECAIQEAINGGAVAFLVNTQELKTTLENGYNLNDDELFTDYERYPNEDNFSPFARLRVRRLMTDDGKEFAIPDVKVYGKQTIPGFYQTLKNFLHEKQPISLDEFWESDWEKRGGTYYDSGLEIDNLIKNYFDQYIPIGYTFSGSKDIEHNVDDKSMEKERKRELSHFSGRRLERECNEITEAANNRMSYCNVGFSVNDGDEDPYIFPEAYGEYSLKDLNIPETQSLNFSIDDETEYRDAINGDYDDDISWTGLFNWLFGKHGIRLSKFEIKNNSISFEIYTENVFFTSNEYDEFVDNISDFDRFLSRLDKYEWLETLEEIGIFNSTKEEALQYMIDNGSEDLLYDDSIGDRNVEWQVRIDSITDETLEKYQDHSSYGSSVDRNKAYMGDTFAKMLLNYLKQNYKPSDKSSNNQQQTFENFFESYYTTEISTNHGLYMDKLNFDKIKINVDSSEYAGTNVVVTFSIRIDLPFFDFTNVEPILFLDKHLDDLRHMASYAYILEHQYIDLNDPKYSNYVNGLKRVYGKYLNS